MATDQTEPRMRDEFERRSLKLEIELVELGYLQPDYQPKNWETLVANSYETVFAIYVGELSPDAGPLWPNEGCPLKHDYALVAAIQLGHRLSSSYRHLRRNYYGVFEVLDRLPFQEKANLLSDLARQHYNGQRSNWPWD